MLLEVDKCCCPPPVQKPSLDYSFDEKFLPRKLQFEHVRDFSSNLAKTMVIGSFLPFGYHREKDKGAKK